MLYAWDAAAAPIYYTYSRLACRDNDARMPLTYSRTNIILPKFPIKNYVALSVASCRWANTNIHHTCTRLFDPRTARRDTWTPRTAHRNYTPSISVVLILETCARIAER